MSRLGAAISSSEMECRGCCCPKEEEKSAQPGNDPAPTNCTVPACAQPDPGPSPVPWPP